MKTKCPYCNYQATEHETLDDKNNPEKDDISFCIDCGEVSVFKDKGLIKVDVESFCKETREELNDFWDNVSDTIEDSDSFAGIAVPRRDKAKFLITYLLL